MNGITITIPAGGADIDNLDSRLIKDANKAAGRWLWLIVSDTDGWCCVKTYVELKNNSVNLKKRARCLLCSKPRSRKEYSRM